MIVLNNMAFEADKDPRVTDLFTEGSHHINLSVIELNQNLYFSKYPTQRRNSHYLGLFNNPVDRQPVMTLAGQMYRLSVRASAFKPVRGWDLLLYRVHSCACAMILASSV